MKRNKKEFGCYSIHRMNSEWWVWASPSRSSFKRRIPHS